MFKFLLIGKNEHRCIRGGDCEFRAIQTKRMGIGHDSMSFAVSSLASKHDSFLLWSARDPDIPNSPKHPAIADSLFDCSNPKQYNHSI